MFLHQSRYVILDRDCILYRYYRNFGVWGDIGGLQLGCSPIPDCFSSLGIIHLTKWG